LFFSTSHSSLPPSLPPPGEVVDVEALRLEEEHNLLEQRKRVEKASAGDRVWLIVLHVFDRR
tara:strand:- start:1884 stop:2069 length:186 start_codon:yes stop_codon:yes gene_type:complete